MVIKEQFVSPILMWIIVIIGIVLILNFMPNTRLINIGFYGLIIFIITLIYWLYFIGSALFIHRKAVSSVGGINNIVKTGIYKIVRHPIYSSDIVLAFGIFFIFQTFDVLLCIIWLSVVLFFWMKLEEKSLIRKFGKEYEEYKRKVPMFIPNFIPANP